MSTVTRQGPFHRNSFGMSRIAWYCFLATLFSCPVIVIVMLPVIGLWVLLSILLVFPGSILVSGWLEDKVRDPVRDAVGDEALGDMRFAEAALRYLGHETRHASDDSMVVDESFLVYVEHYLNATDIESARVTAEKEGVSPVFAVESRFGKSHVSESAYRIADKHDIMIYDWNDVFDAVYEKIKSNGRVPAKR